MGGIRMGVEDAGGTSVFKRMDRELEGDVP